MTNDPPQSEKEGEKKTAPVSASILEDERNVPTIAALAYVVFFLPLLVNRDNEFAMFHANQGLILLVTAIVVNVFINFIGMLVPFIGWLVVFIFPLASLFILALFILGIMNALNGEKKELPVVGGFRLLK